MKCQKCGKNEVNFHYSSNVNGNMTETHLCSQCAAESGFDIGQIFSQGQLVEFGQLFDLGTIFDGMFPVRGVSGFVPLAIPMMTTNQMSPFTMRPHAGMIEQDTSCACGCGKNMNEDPNYKVDEEMKLRRELNAQMRAAVEKEEFEKAAELRDKIKEIESGRMQKCDSETTTQDSPTAQ